MKPKVTYEETYKTGAMKVSKQFLPQTLPHLKTGSKIIGLELLKAGTFDDGTEFQNIRIVVQPPPQDERSPT